MRTALRGTGRGTIQLIPLRRRLAAALGIAFLVAACAAAAGAAEVRGTTAPAVAPGFALALGARVGAAPDDTISADTISADSLKSRPSSWTMDELKTVLGKETGEEKTGGYREPKSGRVAMLCAVIVPGLGQMYNEKPLKAAIGFGLETVYLSRILFNWRSMLREERARDAEPVDSYAWQYHDGWASEYRARSVDWVWYSGAVVLGLMVDAYVDAHLYDMRFKVGAGPSGDAVAAQIAFEF